jgi:hypothetical protein
MKHIVRIYTPIEAILLFIVAMVLGFCVLIGMDNLFHVMSWHESVLKALLLIFALSIFGMLQAYTSADLTIEMDKTGIQFIGGRGIFGFFKRNTYIYWQDVRQWYLWESHLSGQAWSPKTFMLQQMNGKKIHLYLPDDDSNTLDFNSFLSDFQYVIDEVNTQNKGISKIREGKDEYPTMFFIMAIIIFILLFFIIRDFWLSALLMSLGQKIIMIFGILFVVTLDIWLFYHYFQERMRQKNNSN